LINVISLFPFLNKKKNENWIACSSSCLKCNGPLSTNCVTCPGSQYLLNGECLNECPSDYFIFGGQCQCIIISFVSENF